MIVLELSSRDLGRINSVDLLVSKYYRTSLYSFCNKYGYDRSDEYAKEDAVYIDTTANEIARIIEYINTSKIIDI